METVQVLDPIPDEPKTNEFPLSNAARMLVALLSIAAGTIHLVMVPSHAGSSMIEGLGFAMSGWFQIGFAVLILSKPSKSWMTIGIIVNVAFIALWAYTRTRGLPFGAHPNHPESPSFINLTTVGIEVALILALGVLRSKPRLGEDLDTGGMVVAAVVPLSIVALTTAVLASPSARDHAGGSHGDHGSVAAGSGAADHHASGATGEHHEGMDHSTPAAASGAAASDGHTDHAHDGAVATPAAAERCDWEFNTSDFWARGPAAEAEGTAKTHAEHEAEAAAAGGGDHHSQAPAADGTATKTVGNQHGLQWWVPMADKAACEGMKGDLATMEAFAKKYPTAQDAVNAGCIRVTIYVPGIAAHYACFKNWDAKLDVNNPEMLLYGGSQPWAPLVGLSYYYFGNEVQSDWQNGNMPFHIHQGLCVKGALVIGGDNSDPAKCEANGGKVMGKTGNMGHYWVPNCSSPDGVFSADNPRLDMGVANFNDDPKYDPAAGGDPTVLQEHPCQGAVDQNMGTFGPPPGVSESAAGPTK